MTKMCKCCYDLKGKELEKYIEMTGNGRYICKKCGHFAEDKKNLCSPEERTGEFVKNPVETSNVSKNSKKFEKKKIKNLEVRELREIIKNEMEKFLKPEHKSEEEKN